MTELLTKRSLKPSLLIFAVLLVLADIGWSVIKKLHHPPPPPRTVSAHYGDMIIDVSETGTIEPVDKVDIRSKAAGRLLSIPITEGQYVTRGQLIATVDRSQIDPQLARDQAQLLEARAKLSQAQAQYALQVQQTRMAIITAQANLNTSQAHLLAVQAGARPQELAQQQQAVARAQITVEDAARTQKRKAALLARGFISQSEADASQVALDTAASSLATAQQQLALTQAGPRSQDVADAKAQRDAAHVAVASAQANIGQNEVSRSNILQAQASIQQIAGDIQQLDVNIADTRIIAPASGIVLKKYKQPNEIVQSATTGFSDTQSLVATLGSKLLVRVGINEVDIAKVHSNAPATIHVDALPDAAFSGRVSEIAPASTNAFNDTSSASGGANSISKFNVKVVFDHYAPRLRPGMSANVDIISQRHIHALLVPLEAVPFSGAQGQVSVLNALSKSEKRTITTGLRNETEVEALSGLHAGDRVVVPAVSGSGRRKTDITP